MSGNMSYRDLTKRFRELRAGFKKDSSGADSQNDFSTQPLVLATNNTINQISIEMQMSPVWSETLMSMDNTMEKISQYMSTLIEYHSARTRIVFENEKATKFDTDIQETTMAITALFKQCKTQLKKIANDGTDQNKLGYEERQIRYNIMRSRTLRIQELSKEFRNAQRLYLQQIKLKEDRSSTHFSNNNVMDVIDLDRVQQGMTPSQLQELEHIELNADQRTKDIIQIAKSVHELAQLFEELSVLVCEQGSALDRIDYNIEQVVEQLGSAKKHINKAVEHQKRSRTALCIIVLIVIIFLAAVVLILRNV